VEASTGEPKYGIEKIAIYDLVSVLTNKKADNIKKRFQSLFKGLPQIFEDNLTVIRPYFERLQLQEIVVHIDKNLRVQQG
jgi:hypothetical protein